MKADKNFINQFERLLERYEIEVEEKRKKRILTKKTADTYLRHVNTFLRWCKDDFVPGGRNMNK